MDIPETYEFIIITETLYFTLQFDYQYLETENMQSTNTKSTQGPCI